MPPAATLYPPLPLHVSLPPVFHPCRICTPLKNTRTHRSDHRVDVGLGRDVEGGGGGVVHVGGDAEARRGPGGGDELHVRRRTSWEFK